MSDFNPHTVYRSDDGSGERNMVSADDYDALLRLYEQSEKQLVEAKKVLEDVRNDGIDAHKDFKYGCEDCSYGTSGICARICQVLGET